ncbi:MULTISPECIES: SDR family oxidoreductase [Nitrosomonas]|uniref:Short-chain dehydrogenase/reductase (SDR) superfamily n=1 Tax=Nitrosomonas europaea (strain ATCC 19718 / CIP 103999 / KCTC 2705 / NBRC 14298) TaxID=228410 RepID=Q82WL3_NITEU|nr:MULTISPECIES: SDR family oxidoreductase [Nitrosomonas]CAD84569.1 Short-chain dehydrogenase/reductase (SDR) superfamily [Nitrosomonas europaea ATCC 19718]SDW05854.1 NAD(P)-dependent dehydrogenase, short-chain alcohol dehydrogenase family [Nitrosomonas europaea]SES69478.1 NAD(P)-dependent dehydrogenase, short-chain alcohol dehydrogenase family [Nitrosomonas europaea]SJZ30664.1 NAD(P)-dependent dehydrogenase, short-chain alcohol dehydrogenase family [Nitrosomonas europaea]HBF24407.1 KR domain-
MNTVLITGANRGIGLEFARQYAADGWQVVACCRQPQQAEALNRLADQYKDRFSIHRLDVRELAEIDQLSHKLQDLSIDILINNAGVYPHAQNGEFGRISYDDWMEAFRVNTFAPLKMVEALIEQIACSQLKIVATITSKMGSIADNQRGGSYIYRSSKAAVNTVVKSLAIDLQPRGIIAVLLHPGWVQTDMGGRGALISTKQSVTGMKSILDRVTHSDTGKFIAYDGQHIPW